MPPVAPLPVLAGVYYARAIGTADLRPVSNVFTYQKPGTPLGSPDDATNALAVSNAIAAFYPALVDAALHVTYTGTEVSTYPLGSPTLPAAIASLTAPGGRLGPISFLQVAGRIKHAVYRRGKGSQSETYLSPLSVGDITVNGDQMTDAWVTNVSAAWAAFDVGVINHLETASPGVWKYVQLSKFHAGTYAPATFDILTSQVEHVNTSQKRRLGR